MPFPFHLIFCPPITRHGNEAVPSQHFRNRYSLSYIISTHTLCVHNIHRHFIHTALTRNHRVAQIVFARRFREIPQLPTAQLQLPTQVGILQNAFQRSRQLVLLLLLLYVDRTAAPTTAASATARHQMVVFATATTAAAVVIATVVAVVVVICSCGSVVSATTTATAAAATRCAGIAVGFRDGRFEQSNGGHCVRMRMHVLNLCGVRRMKGFGRDAQRHNRM